MPTCDIAFEDAVALLTDVRTFKPYVEILKSAHTLLGSTEPFSLRLGLDLLPAARAEILRQHPELATAAPPDVSGEMQHEQLRRLTEWREAHAPREKVRGRPVIVPLKFQVQTLQLKCRSYCVSQYPV